MKASAYSPGRPPKSLIPEPLRKLGLRLSRFLQTRSSDEGAASLLRLLLFGGRTRFLQEGLVPKKGPLKLQARTRDVSSESPALTMRPRPNATETLTPAQYAPQRINSDFTIELWGQFPGNARSLCCVCFRLWSLRQLALLLLRIGFST